MMTENPLLVILGATASGKTKLAVALAKTLNGEVISADSRQVFKTMDIGTGKDLKEFNYQGGQIPYHLIDILEPGDRYNVDAFKNDFYHSFITIHERGKLPILCGGTGLYMHSLFQNQQYTAVPANLLLRADLEHLTKDDLIIKIKSYPSENTNHVDLSSKKRLIRAIEVAEYLKFNTLAVVNRPKFKPLIFGLKNEVENTRRNILQRLAYRLESGLIEEVQALIDNGISHETLIFYGLEYKFISNYLTGILNYNELKEKLGIAICQFAKRQNTFFRKMEKDGVDIIWLDAEMPTFNQKEEVLKHIKSSNLLI